MTGKMIALLVSLATLISLAIGGVMSLEGRYARCEDVKQIDRRLDLKIRADKLDALQQRYWKFEDRYGKEPGDPLIRQDMREQQTVIHREMKEIEQFGVPAGKK